MRFCKTDRITERFYAVLSENQHKEPWYAVSQDSTMTNCHMRTSARNSDANMIRMYFRENSMIKSPMRFSLLNSIEE